MKTQVVSRRQFLQSSAGIAGTLTFGSSACGQLRTNGSRNVILIISDTMRRDALGCFGGRWVQTPHLDAFAKRAVRCENAFICSFPTVPTRHDILTGQYTFTYKPWSPLDKDTATLQDVLRQAGVYTALVVDTPHPFTTNYNYQTNFDFVQVGPRPDLRPS